MTLCQIISLDLSIYEIQEIEEKKNDMFTSTASNVMSSSRAESNKKWQSCRPLYWRTMRWTNNEGQIGLVSLVTDIGNEVIDTIGSKRFELCHCFIFTLLNENEMKLWK